MPRWFLYLNGAALIVLGVALLRTRPRQPGDGIYRRYVNLGTLWAVLCCLTGLGLLGIAGGYLRLGDPSPPRPTVERPPWRPR